jgi:hypothetical protein
MTTTVHGHRHGRTCYWDHLRCGWVCAAPQADPVVGDAGPDRAVDAAAGSLGAPGTAPPRAAAQPQPA